MINLKKIVALSAIAACGFLFAGTRTASAQTASDSIVVTAVNEGVFSFAINDASYDFGTVNANGVTSGTSTGINGAAGATFEKLAASTFTVMSAPTSVVHINNASTVSTIVWGTADSLTIKIPSVGAGTGCGYVLFTTVAGAAASCTLGTLIHAMSVGNDTAAVTGNIDLKLTVANTDIIGSNSWTVLLTASAI